MSSRNIEITDLDQAIRLFGSKIVDKAVVSSINKIGRQARTFASKEIRREYNIKARDIKKSMTLKRARRGRKEALLLSRGKGLPLSKFAGKRPAAKRPVRVKVKRTGSKKLIPLAFWATMPSGHDGIFWVKSAARNASGVDSKGRPRKGRLPIRELFGPSVPQMLAAQEDDVVKFLNVRAPDLFNSELAFFVQREAGR